MSVMKFALVCPNLNCSGSSWTEFRTIWVAFLASSVFAQAVGAKIWYLAKFQWKRSHVKFAQKYYGLKMLEFTVVSHNINIVKGKLSPGYFSSYSKIKKHSLVSTTLQQCYSISIKWIAYGLIRPLKNYGSKPLSTLKRCKPELSWKVFETGKQEKCFQLL